jgi:hypothetical protein
MTISEGRYIKDLINILEKGAAAAERMGAARGLGHVGGADAANALLEAAHNAGTSEERGAAAEALGMALVNSRPKGR